MKQIIKLIDIIKELIINFFFEYYSDSTYSFKLHNFIYLMMIIIILIYLKHNIN